MRPYIRIPKTDSKPAEPNSPSFLTTLPPELRNRIYEVLFRRNEPVLVHNASVYHAREPDRNAYTQFDDYCTAVEDFDEIYDVETGGDSEFRHDFHLGLLLLQSCRQIYHESAGVLYGCNEFVISRALFRHDIDPDELHDGMEGDAMYSQLDFAPRWISELGFNSTTLRKVVIDVGAICPANCDYHIVDIDILPLARFIWFHANSGFHLMFAHTGKKLLVQKHLPSSKISIRDALSCIVSLESTLGTLCSKKTNSANVL
jgi:hypothetical protein